jgi:hypothetical protein
MSLFGLGSKSTKTHSWIDPQTRAFQVGNYQAAQGLAPTYTPTSAGQINQYLNPYRQEVVDHSLRSLDRARQMTVNGIGDAAQRAHAFGGSRHAVAEALTNGEYANQAGLLAAGLFKDGYGQALDAAMAENRFGFQYPLSRQTALNDTLRGVTPETFSKVKDQDPKAAMANFGNLLKTGGDIAKLIASFG